MVIKNEIFENSLGKWEKIGEGGVFNVYKNNKNIIYKK